MLLAHMHSELITRRPNQYWPKAGEASPQPPSRARARSALGSRGPAGPLRLGLPLQPVGPALLLLPHGLLRARRHSASPGTQHAVVVHLAPRHLPGYL